MLSKLTRVKKFALLFSCGVIVFAIVKYPEAAVAAVTAAFGVIMAVVGLGS